MGEEEPPARKVGSGPFSTKENWFWSLDYLRWQPVSFSTDLDQAMRAVDKVLDASGERILETIYDNYEGPHWQATYTWIVIDQLTDSLTREAKTLPEAICKVLLALVGKEGS
jgi:hypothetical protein